MIEALTKNISLFSKILQNFLRNITQCMFSLFFGDGAFKIYQVFVAFACHWSSVPSYYKIMANICFFCQTQKKPKHSFPLREARAQLFANTLLFVMRQYIPQQSCLLNSVHIHRPIILCAVTQLSSDSTHFSNNIFSLLQPVAPSSGNV